ncbi:hypothetical protein G3N95_24340 [Paraburkholderia sp. Tr-20389]|uniref:hypothetical protein n=1 Tax=Paraburkholderia sp. Tr-20389 TaxID=2703903 RepID=UPI00197DE306|nr:hypothetical protein [Paraburkholderia sp. Tr-20389]MBN3756092.1 hypothetical protein [Paraburkholderia sp. Tr-20389]
MSASRSVMRATQAVFRAMEDKGGMAKWVLVAQELLDEQEDTKLVSDTLIAWLKEQFAAIHAVPVVPAPYAMLVSVALDQVRWDTIAWRLIADAETATLRKQEG